MGELALIYHNSKGDFMILGKTSNEIIVRTFKYKFNNQRYSFKKCIDFTEGKGGIHFSLFSDDIVIPLDVFRSLTTYNIKPNAYFK